MSIQNGAELLAERLGTDIPQAALLLDRFAAGMAAALLGTGALSIEGVGSFSVVHDHAASSAAGKGAMFMPPKNRISFDPRIPSRGGSTRIAVERLGMEPGEAQGFAKAIASVCGQLRKRGGEFELRGFGRLSADGGKWGFRGDPGLEELLNGLYEGLKGIEMPDRSALDAPAAQGRFMKPAAIGMAAILLCAGAYFASTRLPSSIGGSPTPQAVAGSVALARHAPAPPAPTAASPDSLVLGKGRYTVIAATFSSLKTAREEAKRLSGLGHRIMIWPVRSEGHRYYRLVTGDFTGFGEARDSLRNMPAGLSKNVYIQQAYKNVVIYGEHGL
ncbi:MAG: SPOR domain-containing protein [Chlorobiaceae bacterium]|nr:SPOR domain-containing protein [Chlorobiaceae bacterium]